MFSDWLEEKYEDLFNQFEDLLNSSYLQNEDIDTIDWCGTFYEYGLDFSYVAIDTYKDMNEGFWRYQISTGGPGSEYRIYVDMNNNIERIEFWFLDWFDGASISVPKDSASFQACYMQLDMACFEHMTEIKSYEALYIDAMQQDDDSLADYYADEIHNILP